jgi:hypothetical protein
VTVHEYPVYLHIQPSSFRAIKLYSDFGFSLLSGDNFVAVYFHFKVTGSLAVRAFQK